MTDPAPPTPNDEPRYAAANMEREPERARLEMLEQLNDAATLRRITTIGVERGWRCLELGAGAGSIARALADRVGPDGLVVAADRDPRFLDDFPGPGCEVVTHDIMDGPVTDGGFDFAHCRAVLGHVDDLDMAVRHLVTSVRPGGWVLCEEADYGAMEPCDPEHPHAPDLARLRAIMTHGARVDGLAGRHVFGALRAVGLTAIRTDIHGAIAVGGTPRAHYRQASLGIVQSMIRTTGIFPDTDIDRMVAMFDDPTFVYIDNSWIATWGQRPE